MQCKHEIEAASCAYCNGKDAAETASLKTHPHRRGTPSREFAARFASKCSGCGERIEEGQMIHYNADDQVVCCE